MGEVNFNNVGTQQNPKTLGIVQEHFYILIVILPYFLAMLLAQLWGWQSPSVCQSTTLVQIELSKQLLDGSP